VIVSGGISNGGSLFEEFVPLWLMLVGMSIFKNVVLNF
jgi:hypothetical protein